MYLSSVGIWVCDHCFKEIKLSLIFALLSHLEHLELVKDYMPSKT